MNSPRTKKLPVRKRVYYFLSSHFQVLWWVMEYVFVMRVWTLAPLILLLMIIGIFIFATTNPAVSVFLYPLF